MRVEQDKSPDNDG